MNALWTKRIVVLWVVLAGFGVHAQEDEIDLAQEWKSVARAVHAEVLKAHKLRQDYQAVPGSTNLLADAERCYQRALVFAPVLQQIPVGMCEDVLVKGTAPDKFRPTLFDITVHDLLDFYVFTGKSGADRGEVALDADGPAFDDVQGFRAELPSEAVQRSRVLRALRLYQALLAFHEKDKDTSAYVDADLNRLQFCHLFAAGDTSDTRYAAALDRFCYTWRKSDVMSRATALRARLAFEKGDAGFARMLALNGAKSFPESIGAAQCRNLVAEVETPDFAIAAPAVWRAPWPSFTVTYKNLTQVSFRAMTDAKEDPAALLGHAPIKAWVAPLPPAGDYRVRDYELAVPRDLPSGRYAVFASPDGRFEKEGAPVFWARVRVGSAAAPDGPVAFSQVFGEWKTAVEPDEWRYCAWRGADGRALSHRAALRERKGSDTLKSNEQTLP